MGTGAGTAYNSLAFSTGRGLRPVDGYIWRSARASIDSTVPHQATISGVNEHLPSTSTNPFDAFTGQAFDGVGVASGASDPVLTATTLGNSSDPLGATNRRWLGRFPADSKTADLAPIVINGSCWMWTQDWDCTLRYHLWASDIRVWDAQPPAVTAVSGALIDAGGGVSGTASGLTTTTVAGSEISDPQTVGSGIRQAIFEVDGQPALTVQPAMSAADRARCTPTTSPDGLRAYAALRPCPQAAAIPLVWDSRSVADGRRAVRLFLEDAAGHRSVAASGSVLVANGESVGPGSPLELRGDANGTPATDAGVLRVFWPETARKASTRAPVVKRCRGASYAEKHPSLCKGRPADTSLTRAWSPSRQLTGTVQLQTDAGQPIAGARVELRAISMATGAPAADLPPITTGTDGTATFSVPVASGSRTIEARWSARSRDSRPAATGTATIVVAASTSLSAPKRVAPGAKVTFRGRLDGRAGTLGQVPVQLEVKAGGAWKTFATASTDNDGSWSTTLPFAKTPGRYPVRAKVGTSTTYPYAAGESARVTTVRVR